METTIKLGEEYGGRVVVSGPHQKLHKNGQKAGLMWGMKCKRCGVKRFVATSHVLRNLECACGIPDKQRKMGHAYRGAWQVCGKGERMRQEGEW